MATTIGTGTGRMWIGACLAALLGAAGCAGVRTDCGGPNQPSCAVEPQQTSVSCNITRNECVALDGNGNCMTFMSTPMTNVIVCRVGSQTAQAACQTQCNSTGQMMGGGFSSCTVTLGHGLARGLAVLHVDVLDVIAGRVRLRDLHEDRPQLYPLRRGRQLLLPRIADDHHGHGPVRRLADRERVPLLRRRDEPRRDGPRPLVRARDVVPAQRDVPGPRGAHPAARPFLPDWPPAARSPRRSAARRRTSRRRAAAPS